MTLLCELHLPFFPSHQSLQFVRGNHLFRDKGKGQEDKEKGKEDKDKGKEGKDKDKEDKDKSKERQIQKTKFTFIDLPRPPLQFVCFDVQELATVRDCVKIIIFPTTPMFLISLYTISILGCLDGPSSTDMCSQFIISKTGSPEVGLDVKLKRFSRGPGAIYNWSLLTFK